MTYEELDKIIVESIENSSNRLEFWAFFLKRVDSTNACEIGVWKGDFARYLLDRIDDVEKYYFIDPWRNLPSWNKPANRSNQEFENIRSEALEKNKMHEAKIRELRMTTKEAAEELENESLNFAYIDGDHTLRGITIDLNVIYPKIKVNGFIGGDDFTKNIWQHPDEYDPTEVFPYALYFSEAKNCTIVTLPYNQFLIFKNDRFEVIDYGRYGNLTPKQIYSRPSKPGYFARFIPRSISSLLKKFR